MVWGGRRLNEVLGKDLPTDDPYGESWEISDHASHHSVVANGPLAGKTLRELMGSESQALLGRAASRFTTFPWLIKFLDANDWLSVQVHPDEEAVARLAPEEDSKTEAWFILSAAPDCRIYAGLLPGVDEKRLREALAANRVLDCLHHFTPHPGDCVFLPAGTVHAIGGGVLMAEVQQTSDVTYRLFDWNRTDASGKARQLHLDQAMECIDWDAGPIKPIHAEEFPETPLATVAATPLRQKLVTCPYFTLEYVRQFKRFACGGNGHMQVVVVLHGLANLKYPWGSERIQGGQALLLPASMPTVSCSPMGPLGLLVVTLP
jgi:mannose-6-phosphate isomerase